MSKKRINCKYCIPHELSGIGNVCALMHTACNGLGKRCVAYDKETAEERKWIEDKIKEAKAGKEKRNANEPLPVLP